MTAAPGAGRRAVRATGLVASVLAVALCAWAAVPSLAAWSSSGRVATTITASDPTDLVIDLAGAGDGFTLLLAQDGHVYAAGSNANGRLGDGTTIDRVVPVKVALPDELTIVYLEAGINGGIALTSTGTAWFWGGAQGPTPVAADLGTTSPVVEVDTGGYFSMAVTADGSVYSWGNNGGGRLGRSDLATDAGPYAPGRVDAIPAGFDPIDVDAGRISAGAWNAAGELRVWGSSRWGGAAGVSITFSPPDGEAAPTGIRDIAISTNAVFIVDTDGRLWKVFNGSTEAVIMSTAVGLDVVDVVNSFSQSSLADPDADIGTFLTTSDGSLYAFGDNSYGQLGLDPATTSYAAPTLVPLDGTPRIVAAGDQHTVLVTTDNDFAVAGNNSYGQFGTGVTDDTPTNPFTVYRLLYWPSRLG
jgi:alpha-tubulin suppressor-like RCC1 family protein